MEATRRADALSIPNPLGPELLENPYPVYQQLLREPACWHPELRVWLFTRHADCVSILSDPRFSRNIASTRVHPHEPRVPTRRPLAALADMHRHWFLLLDPPDHTRLRAATMRALNTRMKQLPLRIQAQVEALLYRTRQRDEMDVIEDFASPLVTSTITWLVGASDLDEGLYRRWALALARCADCFADMALREAADDATREVRDCLRASLTRGRHARRDDVLGALAAAREDDQPLSEEEVLATCMLLLFGGYDTSINLIGAGLLALLQHPSEWAGLCGDASSIKTAVEELLRFDSPLQLCSRMAHADVEVGGVKVHAGEWVWVLLGAANRDPLRFKGPDRLDIRRSDLQHVAFGHGIHYCAGAALARLEAQSALGTLARDAPGIRLVEGGLRRRDTAVFRGLSNLRVRF